MEKINIINTPRLFLRPMSESDSSLIVSWRKVLLKEEHHAFFDDSENLTVEKQLSWIKKKVKTVLIIFFVIKLIKNL